MSSWADLHLHSYFSDGSNSPEEIILKAKQKELAAIALTDHDSIDGVGLAIDAGQAAGIEVIPALEFSAELESRDIHILGYFIDTRHPQLLERLSCFQTVRQERIAKMIQNLKKEGIENISYEEVRSLTRSGAVGRMHLALLMHKKGWTKSIPDAFERYIGEECQAYEPKYKQTPMEAIELIRRVGGIAVLAHPMVTQRDEIIPQLVEAGLGGIEACYPNCPETVTEFYKKLAKKHDLALTGGSDSHGQVRNYNYVGKVKIPYEWVEDLRQRIG